MAGRAPVGTGVATVHVSVMAGVDRSAGAVGIGTVVGTTGTVVIGAAVATGTITEARTLFRPDFRFGSFAAISQQKSQCRLCP